MTGEKNIPADIERELLIFRQAGTPFLVRCDEFQYGFRVGGRRYTRIPVDKFPVHINDECPPGSGDTA
jgi:hypothetical protein